MHAGRGPGSVLGPRGQDRRHGRGRGRRGGADAAPAAVKASASAAAATASALVKSLRRGTRDGFGASTRGPPARASVVVATALLRCVPFIAPEEWRRSRPRRGCPAALASPSPPGGAGGGEGRDAAGGGRRRRRATPSCRAPRGCYCPRRRRGAGISLTDADAATSAARTLRDLCETWRVASSEEFESPSDSSSASSLASTTSETFDPCRSEAAGLLMMCSPHAEVRVAAVEMLREVAKLSAALRHSAEPAATTRGGAPSTDRRVVRRGHGPERPRRRRRLGATLRGGGGCRRVGVCAAATCAAARRRDTSVGLDNLCPQACVTQLFLTRPARAQSAIKKQGIACAQQGGAYQPGASVGPLPSRVSCAGFCPARASSDGSQCINDVRVGLP